jgi:NAD+ synthase (glutamine-hydrolysing)
MSKKLRIVLAQTNLMVGDISGNLIKLIGAAKSARDALSADIIVFPELSITGYPPEDLLLRKAFIDAATEALYEFKEQVHDIYCVVGHPYATEQGLYNACSVIHNGAILGRYAKQHLPNYGVFDEDRYFKPGATSCVVTILGIPVGITICEDLWFDQPVKQAMKLGARLILAPNASPYEIDKHAQRQLILTKRSTTNNVPIIYNNCVGGQDELVFDGGSMVTDATGKLCQHAGFFKEVLLPVDIEITNIKTQIVTAPISLPSEEEQIYQALKLGLKDYIYKNNFSGVLIGVSGGIDSALTLALAVDALGKDRVSAILMPSRYTSDISREDALALIKNLGVEYQEISIELVFTCLQQALHLSSEASDITQQNLQARCRGVILMALSNQTGHIVLSTSNRSEMAVGYSTLYGDMVGGFAVLKDVPKTLVYRLTNYRNQIDFVIPQRIIDRAPTAELAPDQKDEDSLPPYAVLDQILALYLDQEQSVEDIIAQGWDRDIVEKVVNLIHKSEYKRRQAPVGTRINHKSFGKDRRYPITSGFKS